MSEISYVVRRARADDAEEVFSLVKDFPPEAIPDRQEFQASFAALNDIAGSVLFVAESASGTVMGYILVSCHPSFLANAPVAWVEEVMVANSWRRTGMGKALMTAAEDWANRCGAAYVALASRRSAPFYLALGYEDTAAFFKKALR
jgi:GNAT superfamily N-acetyltransferase